MGRPNNTWAPKQCNNAYIFPGVALGAILARMTTIPEDVFLIAAKVREHKLSTKKYVQNSKSVLLLNIETRRLSPHKGSVKPVFLFGVKSVHSCLFSQVAPVVSLSLSLSSTC